MTSSTLNERRVAAGPSGFWRVVAIATLIASPVWAQDADSTWPLIDEVQVQLQEHKSAESIEGLVALGAPAAPAVWAILSGQTLTDIGLDLSAVRTRLRPAVAQWPSQDVARGLLGALTPETPLFERLAVLEILTWTDSDVAIRATLEVLAGADALQLQSRRVTPVLRSTLTEFLERDPSRYKVLAKEIVACPIGLLPPIVAAVADAKSQAANLVLQTAAELDPSLERTVLEAVGRRERLIIPGPREAFIELARRKLNAENPRMRRIAAVAAGKLRDEHSFMSLVACLDDQDAVVRRVALKALHDLSGIRRRWDADAWRSWHEGENSWFESDQQIASDLAGEDAYKIGLSLRDVPLHPLFATELVDLVRMGLVHHESSIRARTCRTLSAMDHPDAVPELIPMLHDMSEDVRVAAHAALKQLTAVDKGDSYESWSRWWSQLQ